MALTAFTAIGASLTGVGYQAMRDWCSYTLHTRGIRAWHNDLQGVKEVWAGIDMAFGEDASGNIVAVENFARIVDLSATGLNGWDGTGSISAGQLVYIWLVAKDSDDLFVADNFNFIGSASATAPTMPSGYTYKKLVTACHTETSGASWKVSPFRHKDDRYEYSTRQAVASYSSTRGTAAQSLAALVPANSVMADIEIAASSTSGTVTGSAYVTGMSNPAWSAKAYGGKKDEATGPIYCPSCSINTAASIATTGTVTIYVIGFRWPGKMHGAGRASLNGISMLGIADSLTATHLNYIRSWLSQPIGIENLLITNIGTASPNVNIKVTADRGRLWNHSSNVAALSESIDLTLDVSTTGANGLDTGSIAAGKYYIHLIGKDTDSDLVAESVAGLVSLSATSPTMPSGYTHRRVLGAAIVDGSAHLIPWAQSNDVWLYAERQSVVSTTSTVALTALSLSSVMPTQSDIALISAVDDVSTPSGQCDMQLHVTTSLAKYVEMDADYYEQSQVAYWMPAPSQSVAYAVQQVASYGTVTIYCCGFIWPVEED